MFCGYIVQCENAKETAFYNSPAIFYVFQLWTNSSKFIWNDFQFQ